MAPATNRAGDGRERNLLVISDLHLGGDVRPRVHFPDASRQLERLENELVAFLDYYAATRLDERPWRLVINGDMVDFMTILIVPQDDEASDDERQFGLGHGETQSAAKLSRVLARHPGVFAALSAFILAGNELIIVVGNHDVEFFYPLVQQRFVDGLVALAGSLGDEGRERRLREGVRFCPWFYYEEEVVYVEHGHQYDEYCSFDYQLHPAAPSLGIALSISHAGIRYFSNLVPTMDPRYGEKWGMASYLRWAWAHGMRGMARIFYFYGLLGWKLLEIRQVFGDRRLRAARLKRHRQELHRLAGEYRIAVEKLEALDGLRRPPVAQRLGKIVAALFVDRALLALGTGVLLAAVALLTGGWWRPLLLGSCLLLGVLFNRALSRWRLVPSAVALRRVPEAIRRILRAPFVVFGHSHSAERVPLREGGTYFNTGTWMGDDEAHGFPHLVIHGRLELRAELRRWCEGTSVPL